MMSSMDMFAEQNAKYFKWSWTSNKKKKAKQWYVKYTDENRKNHIKFALSISNESTRKKIIDDIFKEWNSGNNLKKEFIISQLIY